MPMVRTWTKSFIRSERSLTMATEAQKRAKVKYRQQKVKTLQIDLYQTDQDIIGKINSVEKYATYIKQLIRDDIARAGE